MIEISNLRFDYGDQNLFTNLNMRLEPGNIHGLLGLNGAGKSTLLKLMTGLLFPQSGSIDSLGQVPGKRTPSFLSQVFMLPEELNLPGVTGDQYVATLAPFFPHFDHGGFDRYCQEFELPPNRKLNNHSYGQKKKFLLAFGLASRVPLLVLDEPTNGLDIPSKGLFRRLVAEAVTDDRIIVISTHQVKDVETLIDPIVILHEGDVLFNQSMESITNTIRMSHSSTRPGSESSALLYSEPSVSGFWSVWEGGDKDGLIDLEVLFNSVITESVGYTALFNTAGVEP